jgi:hypothetical protein
MKNEIDVIRDLTAKFAQSNIDYMLTGSLAMNYYAQPRMTRDIDLVLALDAKNVDAFISLFSSDYYVSPEAIRRALSHESVFNLIHHETVIKVDCIIRKSSDYRRLEFERRRAIKIQDFTIWIASKDDLIISKLEWALASRSEVQLRDVRNLLATGYNSDYLEKWTRELGLYDLWQECLHE